MKKIECLLSGKQKKKIEQICQENNYTYSEFNRRALDCYIQYFDDKGNHHDFYTIIKNQIK